MDFAEVRADGMDALLGSIGVELGLEGTVDGDTDRVRELRVIKDAKPCINVAVDTLGSEWAGLNEVKSCRVDEGAVLLGLRGDGNGVGGLASLPCGSLLLSPQNSIAAHGGITGKATS